MVDGQSSYISVAFQSSLKVNFTNSFGNTTQFTALWKDLNLLAPVVVEFFELS